MLRILIVLSLILTPALARANKVALVIGNSAYISVAELDNPQNDARDVSLALARQGFDVIAARDLSRTAMRDTLREFRERADQAEVALVYYAGHGIEIGGRNYLVPVDARLEDERDAELEMIELDLVLGQISGAKSLKMVVLDACRNNPFVVKMKRNNAGRSVNSGLGRIDFAGADTLVAYAAAAGEITPDGVAGGNSPFTNAFLTALDGPPTDVRRLLGRVRDKMRETVPGAAPFVYTSLGGGEFVINPKGALSEPQIDRQQPQSVAPAGGSTISQDFVRIDRSGTFQDWNDFLIKHEAESDHPLYAFALEKREALRAGVGLTTPDQPAPQVDGERIARLGVDEQVREEPRNLVIAPVEVVMGESDARRRFQTLLKERGCYAGSIDGILGRGSRAGMNRFEGEAGVTFPIGAADGGDSLRRAIALIEEREEVECPAPVVVRQTPRATPKPRTSAATPAPAPRIAPQVAPAPTEVIPEGSREPRRTKLLPEKGSEQIECIGSRRKFYDCD